MKAIFLVLLSIQLSACLKVSDIPKEDEVEEVPETQPVIQDISSIQSPQVEELESATAYRVHLHFPDGATIVRRFEKDIESSLQAIPIKLANGILTDDQVKSGAHYIYEMGIQNDGSFEMLQTYEVSIPLDLLVDHEIILSKDETWNQYRRIFFTPQGKITTLNHYLMIQADELKSDGGEIRTFPEDSRATVGPGLSGSSIQIAVRSARGNLKVEMRGQHGAHGVRGGAFSLPRPVPDVFVSARRGEGIKITYPPERAGENGKDGHAGGNTGFFDIKVLQEHSLNILPKLEAGKGGDRGLGGPGETPHPNSSTPGPRGADGNEGPSGFKERICLYDFNGRPCWRD